MTKDDLDRNARCPICSKFYHNLDVHNNPVPSPQNKRPTESLCQCAKGKAAREARRLKRLEMDDERDKKKAHKADILGMRERNISFWKEKEVIT